jgi:hypothetical protein
MIHDARNCEMVRNVCSGKVQELPVRAGSGVGFRLRGSSNCVFLGNVCDAAEGPAFRANRNTDCVVSGNKFISFDNFAVQIDNSISQSFVEAHNELQGSRGITEVTNDIEVTN